MKTEKFIRLLCGIVYLTGGLLLENTVLAFETYSGCMTCHGDFRGPTSVKGTIFPGDKNHEMHRNAANMGTACDLCHSGTTRKPVFIGSSNGTTSNQGLGCTGCHVATGLRKHHLVNGVSACLGCHGSDGPPPAENVKPPYYNTPDTKVRNPGNDVLVANTNENWSVGDFVGLDNDGNNLYDLADYAVGPFRLLSASVEGKDVRIRWLTAGGRTDIIQAKTGLVLGAYSDAGPALPIAGVGLVTNQYVEVNGATNQARFYRLKGQVP